MPVPFVLCVWVLCPISVLCPPAQKFVKRTKLSFKTIILIITLQANKMLKFCTLKKEGHSCQKGW